ncbi:MAG: hypothetical protein ABIH42_09575 [Planctomycetota bacterium]
MIKRMIAYMFVFSLLLIAGSIGISALADTAENSDNLTHEIDDSDKPESPSEPTPSAEDTNEDTNKEPAQPDKEPDKPHEPKISSKVVGSYEIGWGKDIFANGTTIYILQNNPRKLLIIDASNATTPVLINSYDLNGIPNSLFVRNNYIYLAEGEGTEDSPAQLNILEVSNPKEIKLLSAYEAHGRIDKIFLGDLLAVMVVDKGFEIVNISNPNKPTCVFYDDSVPIYDVFVRGTYAFFAMDTPEKPNLDPTTECIQITDISTPSDPKPVGYYQLPKDMATEDIFVSGSFLYITMGTANTKGLKIINISDAEYPKLISSCNTQGSAWKVFINKSYAYIADGNKGLQVLDISDAARPKPVCSIKLPDAGCAYNVFANESYAYVLDKNKLYIVEIVEQ